MYIPLLILAALPAYNPIALKYQKFLIVLSVDSVTLHTTRTTNPGLKTLKKEEQFKGISKDSTIREYHNWWLLRIRPGDFC